jgi:hypothetical protein
VPTVWVTSSFAVYGVRTGSPMPEEHPITWIA